jgi:hypothetical protein
LSGKPDHDPAGERVVSVEVRRTRADVQTVFPDVNIENHFTYRLVASDDGWRINKIVHTHASAETPLMARTEVERLLAAMDPDQSVEPASEELASGMTALFSGRFEVLELGTVTTSGVLTAHDFGWVRYDVAPFHRRVPAGSYPVELARDGDGTNVAVLMRFSDQEAIARIPALRVGSGNVVSVDAGNVAILDFAGLTSCGEAQVEEIYQDQAQEIGTLGAVFSLTGAAPEAVMVQSGYGDGAYPAFWGITADGSVTDLVVDFLVAVEDITTTLTIPWRIGPAAHPDLARHAFETLADSDGTVFRYRERAEPTLLSDTRVLDSDGHPISGRGGGVFVQGDISERRWRPDGAIPDGATVEVTLYHGYRHI